MKVEKKQIEVEKVVKVTEESVEITLTIEEAKKLQLLLGNVGGYMGLSSEMNKIMRRFVDSFYSSLKCF